MGENNIRSCINCGKEYLTNPLDNRLICPACDVDSSRVIRDLGNMKVLKERDVEIDYIVLKIGNMVFSTPANQDFKGIALWQETLTKNIGVEDNFWIKSCFTETRKHILLKNQVPFELNIYMKKKENKE